MANEYAPWEPKYPVIYSAASDEQIMTAWPKYIQECARLYELVNRVRTLDASKGTALDDAVPYQLKINTTTDELLVRLGDNSGWVTVGKLAEHFGVTPEDINAVRTSGGVVSWNAGADADRPLAEDAAVGAWYIATDKKKMYRRGESDWGLVFSLNVEDLQNYDTLVKQSETATEGGTAGKLARTNANGVLDFDVSGNAGKLAGVNVAIDHMMDGQTFVYRAATNTITNEDKGVVGSGKSLILKDGDTLLADYAGDETVEVDLGTTALKESVNKTIQDVISTGIQSGGISFDTPFTVAAFDASGEPSKVTVNGTTTYEITRDSLGRLDTVTDGTSTMQAVYNDAGQFLGMEAKKDA